MGEVSDEDYKFVSELVFKMSGLTLGTDKKYLLDTRLDTVARSNNLSTVHDLVQRVMATRDPVVQKQIMEALTTPETLFFRDGLPFEVCRELILPLLLESRKVVKQLRIWSAASSFGQEPYSLAMMIAMYPANLADWKIEVIATDINEVTLERARQAVYSDFEINRGLSEAMKARFFRKEADGWHLADEIRNRVQFRQMNLLDPFSLFGMFDIIFCRNVLIYFDEPTKKKVIERISGVLARDGFLIMGAAETMIGFSDMFLRVEHTKTGIYQKVTKA